MTTNRLEAFSDAVIAIVLTIMVLELQTPHSTDWTALRPLLPTFLAYVLSFIYLGIYWNNHHHLLQATDHLDGRIMWANLHLLFWLSLIPFVTGWLSETLFAPVPTAVYGAVLLMAAIAYSILYLSIIAHHDANQALREAIGKDWKGKSSILFYASALALTFFNHWLSVSLYVIVAIMWFVPDRRIERRFGH